MRTNLVSTLGFCFVRCPEPAGREKIFMTQSVKTKCAPTQVYVSIQLILINVNLERSGEAAVVVGWCVRDRALFASTTTTHLCWWLDVWGDRTKFQFHAIVAEHSMYSLQKAMLGGLVQVSNSMTRLCDDAKQDEDHPSGELIHVDGCWSSRKQFIEWANCKWQMRNKKSFALICN